MSESLKVNANSTVLEHKRKHNFLVDKVEKIPNTTSADSGKVLSVKNDGSGFELKTIEGASEVWYHGINLYDSQHSNLRTAQFHILNNSATPLNSVAKIKAWAESISGEVIIGCNGAYFENDVGGVIHAIVKLSNNTYNIYYVDSTGSHFVNNVDIAIAFDTVQDDVNQVL